MTIPNWKPFLDQWSRAILAAPDREYFELPPDVIESGWLGYPPATEEQIAAAEKRLGVTLPPSYRAFLKVSNGWRHMGLYDTGLVPVQEIDLARIAVPDYIQPWLNELTDDDTDWEGVDYHHLTDALLISKGGYSEELLLLNPKVTTPDGEWQAWLFAHWIPGAQTYDSFWALLQEEHRQQVDDNRTEAGRVQPGDSSQAVTAKLPNLLTALDERVEQVRTGIEVHPGHITIPNLQGELAGLQTVRAKVAEIPADAPDLADQLRALAAEFDLRAGQLENQSPPAPLSPADALALMADPESMAQRLAEVLKTNLTTERGTAQGYRTGTGLIRYFLSERSGG